MEFLSLKHRHPSWGNAPSMEEQGEMAVFCRLPPVLCCWVAHLKTLIAFKWISGVFVIVSKYCCYYSWCRWYNMGHNSGDSIGGNIGPSAGSGGINKRHRGSPRNAAKNSAGQLRSSNSAETQMHSKPRLVSWINVHLYFLGSIFIRIDVFFLEWGREKPLKSTQPTLLQ